MHAKSILYQAHRAEKLPCTASQKKECTLEGFKDIQQTVLSVVHEMPIAMSDTAPGQ